MTFTIKPLEWHGPDFEGEYWAAWIGGKYTIQKPNGNGMWLGGVGGYFQTVEEAKAAAEADYSQQILSVLSVSKQEPMAMTPEEIRLEDLKQMATYGGPVVSFEVSESHYLASCDHCGWVGSSGACGADSFGDDSDVFCPRCHAGGADCGKVASALLARPKPQAAITERTRPHRSQAMVDPLNTLAWVPVPVIPTDKMVDAGGRQQASGRGGPDSIYRAMLSASPSLPVVDGGAFTHVAKTKLEGLLADGWQINGYSIHKDDRLGLVTTGAFVGWYTNACEAMEAAESRVLSLEEEGKRLRDALDWYGEQADAVARYTAVTPPQTNGIAAVVQALAIDGGNRSRNALKVNGNG